MFDESSVREATLEYFKGDELATNVFMTKYCLRDNKGNFMEKSPDDMHYRLAKEFARIEQKFIRHNSSHLTADEIYAFLKVGGQALTLPCRGSFCHQKMEHVYIYIYTSREATL